MLRCTRLLLHWYSEHIFLHLLYISLFETFFAQAIVVAWYFWLRPTVAADRNTALLRFAFSQSTCLHYLVYDFDLSTVLLIRIGFVPRGKCWIRLNRVSLSLFCCRHCECVVFNILQKASL
jgi:hypothetical protein